MKERPIIFSGPMVRAILEGRKTQTRRVIKPSNKIEKSYPGDRWWAGPHPVEGWWAVSDPKGPCRQMIEHTKSRVGFPCPYGIPGDRLYVREAHAYCYKCAISEASDDKRDQAWDWENPETPLLKEGVIYKEAREREYGGDAPIATCHFIDPKTREERGAQHWRPGRHMYKWMSRIWLEILSVRVERVREISPEDAVAEGCEDRWLDKYPNPVGWFERLWDSINGKRPGCSWKDNPYVWCIEFKRLEETNV